MFKLCGLVVMASVLTTFGVAQTKAPGPATTFLLQAHDPPPMKLWTLHLVARPPVPVMAATEDRHTLLALIPQEGRTWVLQRLTGWQGGAPKTEQLSFDGDESTEREDYVRGGMTVAPDGQSLLVRIFVYDLRVHERSAVVLLVDLRSFQIVWRRVTKDPLLANSRLRFAKDGTLVAAVGPSPAYRTTSAHVSEIVPEDVLTMNPAAPGEHEAAVLSFPDLQAGAVCRYAVEVDAAAMKAQARPHHVDSLGKVHYDLPRNSMRRLEVMSQSDSCAALVESAGATSVLGLPGPYDRVVQFERRLGPECEVEDVDTAGKLGLYNCRWGYVVSEKLGFHTSSEDERVIAAAEEGTLLLVPLQNEEKYASTLASADGQDYLVLLRDKLKVEVYRLR